MKPLEMLVEDLRKLGIALMIAGAVGAVVREQIPKDAAYTAAGLGATIWVSGLIIAIRRRSR